MKKLHSRICLVMAMFVVLTCLVGCGGSSIGGDTGGNGGTTNQEDILDESSVVDGTNEDYVGADDEGRSLSGNYPGMLDLYFDQANPQSIADSLVRNPAKKPGRFMVVTIPWLNGNYQTSIANLGDLAQRNHDNGIGTTFTCYLEHHKGLTQATIKSRAKALRVDLIEPLLKKGLNVRFEIGSYNEDEGKWANASTSFTSIVAGLGANVVGPSGAKEATSKWVSLVRCPNPGNTNLKTESVLGTATRKRLVNYTFNKGKTNEAKRTFTIISEWHGHASKAVGYYQYSNDGLLMYDDGNGIPKSSYQAADTEIGISSYSSWVTSANSQTGLAYVMIWMPNFHLWNHGGGLVTKPTDLSGRMISSSTPGIGSAELNLINDLAERAK